MIVSFRLRLFSLFFLFPSHTGVPSAALYPQAAAAAMSYPFYQPIIQPMVKFLAGERQQTPITVESCIIHIFTCHLTLVIVITHHILSRTHLSLARLFFSC